MDKKTTVDKVKKALRNLGYKNVPITVRECDATETVVVEMAGSYFGTFDCRRETFVD
jgi:hypothetical protein